MANKDWGGAYVQFAGFCNVIQKDAEGADFSIEGIFDTLYGPGGNVRHQCFLTLTLVAGSHARQPLRLRIDVRSPDKTIETVLDDVGAALGEPERYTRFHIPVELVLSGAGRYLISLYGNGNLLTRLPLFVLDSRPG